MSKEVPNTRILHYNVVSYLQITYAFRRIIRCRRPLERLLNRCCSPHSLSPAIAIISWATGSGGGGSAKAVVIYKLGLEHLPDLAAVRNDEILGGKVDCASPVE